MVTITSTDSTATLPADAALVGGTRTFSLGVTFGSEGNFTVTATDATDTTKTAATGASTKANP